MRVVTYLAIIAFAAAAGAWAEASTRLTADDFDLSGNAAPYEAAKLIAKNWLREERLKTNSDYEITVYNLKGEIVGYYFIGYLGEGTPPTLEDVIDEYGKSNIVEISREHGEPHMFIKYGGLLRTLTIYTRFGNGGPTTGSGVGIPQTMIWKRRMDETAKRVLGTEEVAHEYVDFENFEGCVYRSGERSVYFSVLPYLAGEEVYYQSLEEVYDAEPGAAEQLVSEEILELKRLWWREIIERELDHKYESPASGF